MTRSSRNERWKQGPGRFLRRAAVAAGAWIAGAGTSNLLAQGCAMCRTAVDGKIDPLSRGISLSVIFMIAMPFSVFAAVAGFVVFTHWREEARVRREGAAEAADLTGGTQALPAVVEPLEGIS